jgi:hypothetical protein
MSWSRRFDDPIPTQPRLPELPALTGCGFRASYIAGKGAVLMARATGESPTLRQMTRDAIMAELLEIEGLLQGDRLNDDDRHALHGAQQALRNILDPETWHQASQTFYRIDNKPSEAVSLLLH